MGREKKGRGAQNLAMQVEGQHVVLIFDRSVTWLKLDPETAFAAAEKMARLAHEGKFGSAPEDDKNYLGRQIEARLTDEMRDVMIQRASIVLLQLYERKKTPGQMAIELVDVLLGAAQGKTIR